MALPALASPFDASPTGPCWLMQFGHTCHIRLTHCFYFFCPTCSLQSHRSSSNALRAQDSSDPAIDKHHTDPTPGNPSAATIAPKHGPETAEQISNDSAAEAEASDKQGAKHRTGAAHEQGVTTATEQPRQSLGAKEEESEHDKAADEAAHADTDGRTAHLASLAEQADIRQATSALPKHAIVFMPVPVCASLASGRGCAMCRQIKCGLCCGRRR